MKTTESNIELRSLIAKSETNARVGFVPTMGNLHQGHIKLVKAARQACDIVVCSIFVNPTQFGPNEDFASYPRTLEADQQKLKAAGCDIVYAPTVDQLYDSSTPMETGIHVPGISQDYCGKSRPGHFDGVATVVCKLLNIVNPCSAYFGLKDYQQFLVIEKMVADLRIAVQIVGVATERESNGLAMSSRNGYLAAEQKEQAAILYTTLKQAAKEIQTGNRNFNDIESKAKNVIESRKIKVDYFSICNSNNLSRACSEDTELVILVAAYLGKTRLIDNIQVQL